jgi:hypothetical protein
MDAIPSLETRLTDIRLLRCTAVIELPHSEMQNARPATTSIPPQHAILFPVHGLGSSEWHQWPVLCTSAAYMQSFLYCCNTSFHHFFYLPSSLFYVFQEKYTFLTFLYFCYLQYLILERPQLFVTHTLLQSLVPEYFKVLSLLPQHTSNFHFLFVLVYKPEGRGFNSRWSHWIFFQLT